MTADWNEKAVFLSALELPPEDREEFLERACPSDSARERIRTLLFHHTEATGQVQVRRERLVPPMQIDEFTILGVIGEGGMGVVYLAQDTVLDRKVALKVLAPH